MDKKKILEVLEEVKGLTKIEWEKLRFIVDEYYSKNEKILTRNIKITNEDLLTEILIEYFIQ